MLSDYINSCESIRKAMGGVINHVSETVVFTKSVKKTTCATVIRSKTLTSTRIKSTHVIKSNGYIIKRCKSSKFTFCTGNTCVSLSASMCETTVELKCILKEFCGKVKSSTNNTCKVLEEIKNECEKYKECNECTGSNDKCKDFIKVTMEHCEKEARDLIIQLNENISPQLLNPIVLRLIGLQLYLRIIQEFSLLRDYFTNIIDNLEKNYDTIKSCTCGNNINRCCSIDGKCLCTIFYKLFQATVSLHDRYCKIIGYMKGESDEDLYKVIPSLSLTRSIILITSYFNEYISSDYMVEEDKCTCKEKNTCPKQSLLTLTTNLVFEIGSLLLNTITGVNDGTCTCHKYSSKLDDILTLLQTGLEDTDDCDGILSDVISMMSPLVKVEDYRSVTLKTKTSEINSSITKKTEIEGKLKEVNSKKSLNGVIDGLNEDSNCDGTTVGSGGGGTGGATCGTCSDTPSTVTSSAGQAAQTGSQGTSDCTGNIEKTCDAYTNGNGASGTCNDGGSTNCACDCPACTSGEPGECCCFYNCKTCPCDEAYKSVKILIHIHLYKKDQYSNYINIFVDIYVHNNE